MILLSFICSISLRTVLDVIKIYCSYKFEFDPHLKGCLVRNSAIPEEVGYLDYLFTDKTGTLTKNEMKLRKIAVSLDHILEVDSSVNVSNAMIDVSKRHRSASVY